MTGPTVAALLAEGRRVLGAVGGGAVDARTLLADALGVPRGRLTLIAADPVPPAAVARFRAALARRAAREPVARILGRRGFWGREFAVTPDVLDPRPETETLVALALERPFARVLDLGTGSGCILVSLLAERPKARGVGTDVSDAALAVAARNAEAMGVADRAELLCADWFEGVPGRFDLIVSNPPYIAADEMAGLMPEVRDHEPHAALTPGGDGLGAYRAIAAGLDARLHPGGRVLLEIGPTQAAAVSDLLRAGGLGDIGVHLDLDGRDRVVSAAKPE
ncbi:peptide chain release factor N(5)-glutamine methyltransferase [Rhodobacteraceae bacterium CCMM004]|nr:peptide chain release factor N(5)-glutamine methyltransferase [Rhodobacteraceae bacterium CCMM004]